MMTDAMPTLVQLDGLDPWNPAHTCPRCRELWAWRDTASIGAIAWVQCVNGHRGAVSVFDLPLAEMALTR